MPSIYPKEVQLIAADLLASIEKHFPGLTQKTFDCFGYPNRKGSPAQERSEMCIYMELMKAGAFNTIFDIKD